MTTNTDELLDNLSDANLALMILAVVVIVWKL